MIVCDLEAEVDVARAIAGSEAVVFAAGAGPGSGPARKPIVDEGGISRDDVAATLHAVLHAPVRSPRRSSARPPSGTLHGWITRSHM